MQGRARGKVEAKQRSPSPSGKGERAEQGNEVGKAKQRSPLGISDFGFWPFLPLFPFLLLSPKELSPKELSPKELSPKGKQARDDLRRGKLQNRADFALLLLCLSAFLFGEQGLLLPFFAFIRYGNKRSAPRSAPPPLWVACFPFGSLASPSGRLRRERSAFLKNGTFALLCLASCALLCFPYPEGERGAKQRCQAKGGKFEMTKSEIFFIFYLKNPFSLLTNGSNPIIRALLIVFAIYRCCFELKRVCLLGKILPPNPIKRCNKPQCL